jgi:hypothetical protein
MHLDKNSTCPDLAKAGKMKEKKILTAGNYC